ncbi:hypothetical protein Hanom_Chr14g01260921 [Helianthus anomalus]
MRGCLVLRFQNCVLKKHVGTCFSKTAFWRQIITFSSKHFFRSNNRIITSIRNPKHPLKQAGNMMCMRI